MGVSRVDYDGRTLIDLTGITVMPDTLLEGVTAINAAGEEIVGTVKAERIFYPALVATVT